jgi:hypothetical protein
MSEDFKNNEEAVAAPTREELLTSSVVRRGDRIGNLFIRKMTAETLSLLTDIDNFFIRGAQGERGISKNNNPMWATGEFIYIHTADRREVLDVVSDAKELRGKVADLLASELASMEVLTAALKIVEKNVAEYFGAQAEAVKDGSNKKAGKALARAGRQDTSA